jgi:hypothetical protein
MSPARFARLPVLIATVLSAALVGLPAASAAPSPSPTPSAGSASTTPDKSATFGIGPSDGHKVDGRAFFNYLSSPGGQLSDHVAIANVSGGPLTLRVYATDAVSASGGGIGYLPASAKPTDAGTWLSVGSLDDVGHLTIAPGATSILPFTMKVPAQAAPGDHTAGLVVSLTSKIKNDKGQDVDFEQRVATRVYVRVSGDVTAKLGVDKLHASFSPGIVTNPLGRGDVKFSYRVTNTANVILGGKQSVQVSGWYGGTKTNTTLADLPMLLPGGSTVVTGTVHDVLPSFKLAVSARVTPVPPANAVDPTLAVARSSVSVWAIPWLIPILVLILLGGGLFFAIRRRLRPKPKPGRHGNAGPKRRQPQPVG